jgi:hypothetical protein
MAAPAYATTGFAAPVSTMYTGTTGFAAPTAATIL